MKSKTPIEELDLWTGHYNLLKKHEIDSVEAIERMSDLDLLSYKNIGRKMVRYVREAVKKHRLNNQSKSDFIDSIMHADRAIRELYKQVIAQLNQQDTDYIIEFKGKTYDFCKPLNADEKLEGDIQKHQVAQAFIADALEKISKALFACVDENNPETWKEYRRVWFNLARLQRETPREESESVIESAQPYEVDEGTSKDLDYESVYVQAQRKDLSDEEKWNLLLNNFVDKKQRSEEM